MFRIFIMNMIGFLNENGPAVTAIAATMTVILTYFYLRHIDKQRHEMVRPKICLYELHPGLSTAEDLVTYLTFWNIGLGHAYNVHFEYLFSTNVILKKLSFDYLKYLFWFRFDNGFCCVVGTFNYLKYGVAWREFVKNNINMV